MSARRIFDWLFHGFCYFCLAVGVGFLAYILISLVIRGLPAFFSYPVFTESTPPPATSGGLLNAIVGTILITAMGMLIAVPVGIMIATYMTEFKGNGRLANAVRFFNDVLLSTPSILLGLFAFTLVVANMGHFSALAGGIALSFIAIPMVVRTTEGVLLLIPDQVREAAIALGIPRWKVTTMIIWRAASSGIITAVLLATARITGETAPLLFTALSSNFFSWNIFQPMANLPVVMFNYALSPYQNWQDLAWAAALLITVSILTMSIAARVLVPQQR